MIQWLREQRLVSHLLERPISLDLMGMLLVAAAIGWTYESAAVAGGSPGPVAMILFGSALAFLVGRVTGSIARSLVPLAAVVFVGVLALGFHGGPRGHAPADPLAYANASAALYLQGTVAGLMLFVMWRAAAARTLSLVMVGALLVVTLFANSRAVDILIVLPASAMALRRSRSIRVGIAVFAGLFLVAFLAALVLGATYHRGKPSGIPQRLAESALSERRPALWHDALVLMSHHPAYGVGPGRFIRQSPIARSDLDARWAHNGFLQQGAEQGVMGLVIVVLLFAWAFVRLWVTPSPDAVNALGAAGLAALGIQACIDYVLHFPAVAVAASALVGVSAVSVRRHSLHGLAG
jgi:O-antigen ligase